LGSGRTEIARVIFGVDRPDEGEVRLGRRALKLGSPADAIESGIGLLTEERRELGFVRSHSVRENFALPNLGRLSKAGFIQPRRERKYLQRYVDSLHIEIKDQEQRLGTLDGATQQKLLLAKWLARDCE